MSPPPTTRLFDSAASPAVADLLRHQNERWDSGDRVAVEDLVRADPSLADDPPRLVPLIVNEWMLRWDVGEHPDLADYQTRFASVADELATQFRAQVMFEQAEHTDSATRATAPSADASFTPSLSGYRLAGEVGSGGMGVVYRAEQLSLGRTVAVKFLLAGRAARDGQIERFLNEGRLLARLDHPNVVRVIEVGTADHSPYIVMEFVDGQTLARHAAGRPLPVSEAARWVELLARAVAYCHERGVLHRDLKPANVLLTHDGVPKLTDFGLAKALDPDGPGQLTHTGDVMGTPSYMAPEQAAGRPVDRPTDVYGLGAILFELLTGRPPFEGESTLGVMKQVLETPARSPQRLRPEVSRDLDTICLKCLEKEPAKRYPTAAALADDLRRTQLGESISARPVGPIERGWRWCRRNRRVAVPAAAIFLVLLTATAVSLGFAGEATRQAGRAESNATAAQQQRDAAIEARWRGTFNEVLGIRYGQRPGQRNAALAKLAEALALAREGGPPAADDRLRFAAEATSAYGLADLISNGEWEGWGTGVKAVRFSPDLSRYAQLSNRPMEVRLAPTGARHFSLKSMRHNEVFLLTGTDDYFSRSPAVGHASPVLSRYLRKQNEVSRQWKLESSEWATSPDGKKVMLTRPDGELVLVNGETGKELHTFGRGTPLRSSSFHPNKPWVVVRRDEKNEHRLVLLDTETGKVVSEEKVEYVAEQVTWRHPDGREFAVAGDDRTVRVCDDSGREKLKLDGFSSTGIFPAYSSNGEYLVTHDWSGELRVWDAVSGRLLFIQVMSLSDSLAVAPDNTITPERDGTLLRGHKLVDRSVRSLALAPMPDEPFRAVVWNPDRTLFVATHGPNQLLCTLHDGHTGKVLAELPNKHIPLWFEPRGEAVVTVIDQEPGGKTDVLYRWPVGRTARTIGPPELLRQQHRFGIPGASADRSVVAFANVVYTKGLGQTPDILDLSKHRGLDIRATAVSPNGRWAVLCSHGQGNCCLYDLQAMKWQAELWSDAGHATFSPDGSTLAVFGAVSGRLYRVSDWGVIRELPGSQGVFTPDGTLLAVSGAARGVPVGTIELIESATGRTVSRFEHPTRSSVDPVGFGPDPAKLYLRVQDTHTLDVWDLRDVRRRLQADFDLDWDWPTFPPEVGPPAEPKPWVVRAPTDWNRWLPKVERLDWNRVLPQPPPASPPKDR